MNKKRVNDWLPKAKEVLTTMEIAKKGEIDNAFRGQISSFGAAVIMGSLPAATAFYASQGESAVERQKLLQAMYYLISGEEKTDCAKILEYVCDHDSSELKELFADASIALKLAMNFFKRV